MRRLGMILGAALVGGVLGGTLGWYDARDYQPCMELRLDEATGQLWERCGGRTEFQRTSFEAIEAARAERKLHMVQVGGGLGAAFAGGGVAALMALLAVLRFLGLVVRATEARLQATIHDSGRAGS